ncbi:DUF2069 domain-containing protein [Shewanella algae]|uniref:DUF2069 domain-containing protein n=1 Tax=Shewanella algae TaxID=38313 RepID=UPI000D14C258|nr:DUF2069 domain-containing protein [Shewanella algae]PST68257.1 hypothetical protein AYI77_04455 [Shewanella algae]
MGSHALLQVSRTGYLLLTALLAYAFIGKGLDGEYSLLFTSLWLLPLLLPLPGILKGNPYTFAWASFILCLYFLHGLTLLYIAEGNEWWFALIESLLISCLLISMPFYARKRGRELGLGLKKRAKDKE